MVEIPQIYDGKENYIFVSYAHSDKDKVWGIIRELNSRGYHVWFDAGIDPGTEWDDNIAEHIVGCHVFLAMMSQKYIESKNCMEEIKFAIEKDRKIILVYLEEVKLPLGLEMRTSNIQAIYKEKYTFEEDFYKQLVKAEGICGCLDDEYIDVQPDLDDFSTFPEIRNVSISTKPMVSLESGGTDATIVFMGEKVQLSERHSTVCQRHIDECAEYVKLVNYYNGKLPKGHKFKVRWIFHDNVNPTNAIGIEYLCDKDKSPLYSENEIKEFFHDGFELTAGIIYAVKVRISSVNMGWDYYFENDESFYNSAGYN